MSMSSPSVPSARPALAAPGWRPGPSTTLSVFPGDEPRTQALRRFWSAGAMGNNWGRCCHGCCHGSGPPPRPERRKPYICRAFAMRRRGLEPPPGYPGPGPQPGDTSVLCVQIAPERPMRPAIWTMGRIGRNGCCQECCHGSRRTLVISRLPRFVSDIRRRRGARSLRHQSRRSQRRLETTPSRPRRAQRRQHARADCFTNARVVCLAPAGVAASLRASVTRAAIAVAYLDRSLAWFDFGARICPGNSIAAVAATLSGDRRRACASASRSGRPR